MTGIDRTICYRSVVPVATKDLDDLTKLFQKVVDMYNCANYTVQVVYCDREFRPYVKVASFKKIVFNFTNTGDHVGEAERNNQFLKERFRVKLHLLPYKGIPRLMICHLAMLTATQANYFPAKGGVSSVYSPQMLMELRHINYGHDCAVPFGSYVQASVATTNTPCGQTRDAIYLGPADNV